MGQLVKLATCVRPAIRQLDRGIVPQIEHAVISGIAIDLQDAFEALQYLDCMFAGPARRIGECNAGWFWPIPCAIIAGECPEVPLLCFTTSGIEDWCGCLVHEQF
jgi:hypothetical protein